MSDDRLRELERRWRTTGAPEDEGAWLSERVRAGELSPVRLHAAAALGHSAARIALSDRVWHDEATWVSVLAELQDLSVQAFAVAVLLREMARSVGLEFRMDMVMMRQWVDDPSAEDLKLMLAAGALVATDAMAKGGQRWEHLDTSGVECNLSAMLNGATMPFATAVAYCEHARGDLAFLREPAFKQTMARHLIPALLGYPDPPEQPTTG